MNAAKPRVIELTEYDPRSFPPAEIPGAVGEALWRTYGKEVAVEFPSPKTAGQWQLTNKGWVGYIPLSGEFGLWLRPRVELANLLRMLEYGYRLKSFRILGGLYECQSLQEFYEHWAHVLARRILDRAQKGLYRTYVSQTERLPYLRGRLDVQQLMRTPWEVELQCHYHDHTADIEENQILAWTLLSIARSGMCTERVLPTIRCAHRALEGFVTAVPYGPQSCIGRLYNRLNDDYHPLHALCRLFLEHAGPRHELGDRTMLPFLIDMARLFELFVAEWLKAHLPAGLSLRAQEQVHIGEGGNLYFEIDLVLYDRATEAALCVLDTKYRPASAPAPDEIAQVLAYAEVKGCDKALLVYPAPLDAALDEWVGDIRVSSATFSLDSDIEVSGQVFLQELLRTVAPAVSA